MYAIVQFVLQKFLEFCIEFENVLGCLMHWYDKKVIFRVWDLNSI